MRTIHEILDAVKQRHGIASDYKLAMYLGVGDTNIRSYRKARSLPDATMCLRLADALGEDPLPLIAEIEAQRAATVEAAELWRRMFERLASPAAARIAVMFAIVFAALTLGGQDALADPLPLAAGSMLQSSYLLALCLVVAISRRLVARAFYALVPRPLRACEV